MKPFRIIYIFLLFTVIFSSCQKDDSIIQQYTAENYNSAYLYKYYNLICRTSKTTDGFFPPQVARAYGYIGLANYEAVYRGIEGASSLTSQLNQMSRVRLPEISPNQKYNWAIASNAAVAEITKRMFEKKISSLNINRIDSLEAATLQELSYSEDPEITRNSIDLGKKTAEAIFEFSKTDGGHESYLEPFQLPYNIPPDPYCWKPTGLAKSPLSPRWGSNRPFMTMNISKTQAPPHAAFSTDPKSEFYAEAMATYNQSKINTNESKEIAKYWADDPFATCTPAGHTFNILIQLLKEENVTLAKATIALAKMGIAENDAFIACWKGKYDYVLIRPVTYIQNYIDPSWNTLIGTPPFPAYTSGHSCEIGAGERIFTDLFTNGSGKYQFTDYSQLQFGYFARSYSSFTQMAEECAASRLYGGIHFPMDNSQGLRVGRAIGDNVNKNLKWPVFVR